MNDIEEKVQDAKLHLYEQYFDHLESGNYGPLTRHKARHKMIEYMFKADYTSKQLQDVINWYVFKIEKETPYMKKCLDELARYEK